MWALPAVLVLAIAAIFVDLWLGGPLRALDVTVARWPGVDATPGLRGVASVLDKIGLRGLTVPLLLGAAGWLRWTTGRWRPLAVVVASAVALTGMVGVMKLLAGRGSPSDAAPQLFVGDIMWPSGHAANIAMTTALLLYLAHRYAGARIGPVVRTAVVAVPSALMTAVSIFLGYHWFSDLLAGALVGLLLVAVVTRLDRPGPRRG